MSEKKIKRTRIEGERIKVRLEKAGVTLSLIAAPAGGLNKGRYRVTATKRVEGSDPEIKTEIVTDYSVAKARHQSLVEAGMAAGWTVAQASRSGGKINEEFFA